MTVNPYFFESFKLDIASLLSPDWLKIMEKLEELSGEIITIGNGEAVLKFNEEKPFQKVFNSLVFIQLLANFKAVSMGLDPDHPSNLNKVVRW